MIEIELKEMKESMARIEALLTAGTSSNKNLNKVYDNADLMALLHVSRRTLATWRDEGVISFSQYASKIYYSQQDVDIFLEKHHVKPTKYRRN